MKITAIIQARMGSSRLPGKVLKPLLGQSVLSHVIHRVQQVKRINEIVIATTDKGEDEVIVEEALNCGVQISRGSEDDVLSRYYHAADKFGADVIVRITSDCPLIDPEISNNVIEKYLTSNVDYCSNTQTRSFPRGLDTEVFSFSSLHKAFWNAKKDYEREHVTPYLYLNPQQFKIAQFVNEIDYSHYRWTLDTPEDWELISKIYEKLHSAGSIFHWMDAIRLMERYPELADINKEIKQKNLGE